MQSWSKIVEDEGMQEHKNEGMFRHLNCIMPERIAQTSAHTHQTTNKNSASHPRICVTWAPTTGAFVAFALFALFASCQRWMTWRLVSQQRTATTKSFNCLHSPRVAVLQSLFVGELASLRVPGIQLKSFVCRLSESERGCAQLLPMWFR